MNIGNQSKEKNNTALPQDVLEKMSREQVREIVLGEKGSFIERKTKFEEKLVAFSLWLASLVMFSFLGANDSLGEIMGLATMGLFIILTSNTEIFAYFSSYKGPIWPITGRPGQRIDKPTPKIIIVIFGWLMLMITVTVFGLMLWP